MLVAGENDTMYGALFDSLGALSCSYPTYESVI